VLTQHAIRNQDVMTSQKQDLEDLSSENLRIQQEKSILEERLQEQKKLADYANQLGQKDQVIQDLASAVHLERNERIVLQTETREIHMHLRNLAAELADL
jgi:hypothetical protein